MSPRRRAEPNLGPDPKLENEVQAGIIAYLERRRDIVFWRQNVGGMRTRNGGFVKFAKKGMQDLFIVQAPEGRLFAVEDKREKGGTVSKDQERWRENFRRVGAVSIVARSIEEVAVALGPERVQVELIPERVRVYPK